MIVQEWTDLDIWSEKVHYPTELNKEKYLKRIYTEYFIGSADWKTGSGGGGGEYHQLFPNTQPILKHVLGTILSITNTDKINTGL